MWWKMPSPITFQDVVIVFCTVTGNRNGQFVEKSDLRKLYAQEIKGEQWSAIQLTTGAGICGVVDLIQQNQISGTGFLRQEDITLICLCYQSVWKLFPSQRACSLMNRL